MSFNPLTLAQSGNAPVKEYTVHYRNLLDVLGPPAGTVGCKVTAPDHFDPNSYTPPVDTLSCVIPLPLVAPLQPYSFQVTAATAQGARSPVEVAQAVDDGAADAQFRIRLEFHAALGLELIDGVEKSDDSGIHQVSDFDARRKTSRNSMSDMFDEREVLEDK